MIRKKRKVIHSESLKRKTRRKLSLRKIIHGTEERPRICVTKTNKNLFVQAINDDSGLTLLTAQTFGKNATGTSANKASAVLIASSIAEKLSAKNITKIVFDRSGDRYTGVVKTLAETLREKGIQF